MVTATATEVLVIVFSSLLVVLVLAVLAVPLSSSSSSSSSPAKATLADTTSPVEASTAVPVSYSMLYTGAVVSDVVRPRVCVQLGWLLTSRSRVHISS